MTNVKGEGFDVSSLSFDSCHLTFALFSHLTLPVSVAGANLLATSLSYFPNGAHGPREL